ncbi:MAG: LytS/YhcK type 5TM receptor domain-containing protein [Desulfitobacteriaceae bacterium]
MELLVALAERLSVIVTVAFLMTRSQVFRRFIRSRITQRETFTLILIYGAFSAIGTYSGVPIHGALANSRAVGAVSAGLLGGPLVGLGAGLIAGLHRYFVFGGFTGLACAISTTVEGLLGGLVAYLWREKARDWKTGIATGMVAELLQMTIILLVARPFDEAWRLVQEIAVPMIIVNGIGVGVFLSIVNMVVTEEERMAASEALKILRIADITLPYLRMGLNRESAQKAAESIYQMTDVAAVALTNREQILAHVGLGSDHHLSEQPILTEATHKVLRNGELVHATSESEIQCVHEGCLLRSAVIVPLYQGEKVIGTLKFYGEKQGKSELGVGMAMGLGKLFSTQLELAEVEQQKELRAEAEIRALQAQIHPHFLFNALNTIASLIRTQPERAREVLVFLGDFLRHNVQQGVLSHSLREEQKHVLAYLAIEKARFGNKLQVEMDVEPGTEDFLLPPLVLQPLVENAVKHGLLAKEGGGVVRLSVRRTVNELKIVISDDGVGISSAKLRSLLQGGAPADLGIGLGNVHQRLLGLYGQGLEIESLPGVGTTVTAYIPVFEQVTKGVAVS